MKKRKFLILFFTIALLLTGCDFKEIPTYMDDIYEGNITVAYKDMKYERPDIEELQKILDVCCSIIKSEKKLHKSLEAFYDFYDVYDSFYLNYNLADIRYCGELTDMYWKEEYNFCAENAPEVEAALDELYTAATESPVREDLESEDLFGKDFFDVYEQEGVWNEAFMALREKEAELESCYYEIDEKDTQGLAELFVELVGVRQQIAKAAGYDSYVEYAYENLYYRDYTPAQAERYLRNVGDVLGEKYRNIMKADIWDYSYEYCSEEDTFSYVKTAATEMGGRLKKAFALLEEEGLYDISYGENKADMCFEIFLPVYYEPFIFMSPYMDQTDKLSFAHEFGHFANDYVCDGSNAGADVGEVHSQAFEYLSLCYNEDTEQLAIYKMADSLCGYVEQSCYALFEHEVYKLDDGELTVENVSALYEEIGAQFGFEHINWTSHFYQEPIYTVSYVVSNDLALQFYQLELEDEGKGLELYEECLESEDAYILEFAKEYELESPFADERLQEVKELFEEVL